MHSHLFGNPRAEEFNNRLSCLVGPKYFFFFRYGDRKLDTGNPMYVNYAYKLSVEEAREFDDISVKKTYPDLRNIRPLVKINIDSFRAHLKDAKWVIIESYEWESGY